ncbi:alpha/beta hydrolase [Flavobacterium seoulense]|uniref:Alpha/beta hydrolase n=2 Tax=Flavobacterium seoulense TaxID=1492738 RepID=A0A066WRQ1_9FLAO|nr:alpha/beta hydrolase [Flavobacterium seoulense]
MTIKMNKIPIYFMPGLAANPLIFSKIKLDEALFEVFYLEWEIPNAKESLNDYAKRIALNIKEENPVLIGVSFGGILVQEIAKHISVRKLIIISSLKTDLEFPRRLKLIKITRLYKLVPIGLLLKFIKLIELVSGEKMKQRMQLYEKFLSVRDSRYLKWAFDKVLLWNCTEINEDLIHIHGDKDQMFPVKNIKNCIVVEGGTHVMVFTKYRWFNANLANIILEGNSNPEASG